MAFINAQETINSPINLVEVSGRLAYRAAKHGMLGLTKCTATDYAPLGIRINAVCPGMINTPIVEKMFEVGDLSKEDVLKAHPINRSGTPAEIADTVLWLCSLLSSFIIDQDMAVDGGYTIV